MLHIYYGFGKGKTSNLNGMVIRALGARKKPLMVRFLKGMPTSEDKILNYLRVDVISTFSQNKFVKFMNNDEKRRAVDDTWKSLDFIKKNYSSYDIIYLDEFLDLVETNLATEDELIEIIKYISADKEVLISGHYKLNKLFRMADLITHFDKEKHYFDEGIEARDGIEK